MRIKIKDTEYSVAMKWEQDDSIRHFVTIDDELIELDIPSRQTNDGVKHISSDEFREILAQHIQKALDARSSDGRT